jgi:nitrate/nitrite-specific signal transduction histidine kinase
MKERAALIHADLQVISTPGTGTTVRLQLPSLAALPALGDPFDF